MPVRLVRARSLRPLTLATTYSTQLNCANVCGTCIIVPGKFQEMKGGGGGFFKKRSNIHMYRTSCNGVGDLIIAIGLVLFDTNSNYLCDIQNYTLI